MVQQEQDAPFGDPSPATGAQVRAAIKGVVAQGEADVSALRALPDDRGGLLRTLLARGHAATVVGVGPVHIRVM